MADSNLKDFIVSWSLFGLLMVSLLSFATFFMYENNPIGLNDGTENIMNSTKTNFNSNLYEVEGDTDELLNITAGTNPETSFLGSRDSVATSYKTYGSAKSFWQSSKTLIGWVFSGDVGKMILSVFTGLIAFSGLYFITKWIRSGS